MKCSKCGEQWDAPAGKSHSFCPSCGSKVESGKKAAPNLDDVQGVLAYIANEYGVDVLLEAKVHTYFADIARGQLTAERKLIKILADEGALDCLKAALGKPESEQTVAIKRAVACLPFAKAEGEDMLRLFAAALGWKLSKPQPAKTSQPSVQQAFKQAQAVQSQQTHTAVLADQNKTGRTISVQPSVGSIHNFANIDWRVLAVENNRALLISEKILENRPYNVEERDITWENCTLRKYLNGEFYNKLGTAKSAIADTRNSNPNNQWFGTAGGNATTDKVFLLSLDELVKYFGDSGDLANKRKKDYYGNPNPNGHCLDDQYNNTRIANYGNKGASWWWLRSPGYNSYNAAAVYYDGLVYVDGDGVYFVSGGVRPALWLNL